MSDELIAIGREDALKAFTDEAAFEAMFASIKALADDVKPDLETAKGRKEHKSFCFKIRKTKARIDDVRTELTEDMRKQIASINGRGKDMVDRLEDLHNEVRKPLTEWEEAEKLRVENIRKAIEDARALGQVKFGETSLQIQERINKLPTHDLEWYAEFKDEAQLVIENSFNALTNAKTAATNAEKEAEARAAEQAELQRLRQAEQERLAKEAAAERERKAEEDRKAAAAREAEAKIAAERAAMERQQQEMQRQLDEANRKAAEAERVAQEAQQRAEAAAEAERTRIAEERAAEERRAELERVAAALAERKRQDAEDELGNAILEAVSDMSDFWAKTVQSPMKNNVFFRELVDAIREGEIRHIRFEVCE